MSGKGDRLLHPVRVELWAGKTLVADSTDQALWSKILFVISATIATEDR